MGKISEMQKNQKDLNLKYVRNNIQEKSNKPRLKIKSVKDLATLIGPSAKKYKLSKNQRNFQLTGRLTIAAIATALAIGGGIAHHNIQIQPQSAIETSDVNTSGLEKEEVLSLAEDTLLSIIYPDSEFLKERASIDYSHSDVEGGIITDCDMITVSHRISVTTKAIEDYSYTRQNSFPDNILSSQKDSPEIRNLLNAMLDVYFDENVSNEDLENLNEIISNLDLSKFQFRHGNIVGTSEKELGDER